MYPCYRTLAAEQELRCGFWRTAAGAGAGGKLPLRNNAGSASRLQAGVSCDAQERAAAAHPQQEQRGGQGGGSHTPGRTRKHPRTKGGKKESKGAIQERRAAAKEKEREKKKKERERGRESSEEGESTPSSPPYPLPLHLPSLSPASALWEPLTLRPLSASLLPLESAVPHSPPLSSL